MSGALPPVRKSIVVPLAPAEAFDLFTRRIGEWWPLRERSATRDAVSCHAEPEVGGRLFERTRDGADALWGVYRVFDVPTRLVFTWHPGAPASAATEVEVHFTAISAGTRVELEHRGWERLGERASFVRGLFEGGWPGVLDRFVARAAGVEPPAWVATPGCIERT